MHGMLADLAAGRIDDEAALAIAEAMQARLHAFADGDVFQPDAMDEIDDFLLRGRQLGLGEIPLDLLQGLLRPRLGLPW